MLEGVNGTILTSLSWSLKKAEHTAEIHGEFSAESECILHHKPHGNVSH